MKLRILHLLLLLSCSAAALAQKNKAPAEWLTPYETSQGTKTATHHECIAFYSKLSQRYPQVQLSEAGPTDSGLPLHVVVISDDGKAQPEPELSRKKRVLFIQNGIHPGEPEGIDASMMLARDLMQNRALQPLLSRVTVVIIPIYNVDGALARNRFSRANQDGPESYGFRGNAKNLDLNRDYIKLDSRNAQSLVQVFRRWQPDVFVDTHTSNGADYQHVLTLLATQPDKLHPALGNYMRQSLVPALYTQMEKRKFPMIPYVDPIRDTPDKGISGFADNPRYSTGYAALFNTIGFMTETHMLKPFDERVKATYTFLELLLQQTYTDHQKIADVRREAIQQTIAQTVFPINFKMDTSKFELVPFKGFQSGYKPSEVSGHDRLYYNRKKNLNVQTKHFDNFAPTATISAPAAYLIPQAWHEVIDRLKMNGVQLQQLTADSELLADALYIDAYSTGKEPYESHYLHSGTKVKSEPQKLTFLKGDYVVLLNQPANRFIVEALEPEAVDSYFNWNFFDGILQQKEWFSDYVFEDIAADLLRKSPSLERLLEEKKAADPEFAKNGWAQLYSVYLNSEYYEKSHKRYPVVRLKKDDLGKLRLE